MEETVKESISRFPQEVRELYHTLRLLVYQSIPGKVEEKLWARLPSYYVNKNFVRLIPFNNHINIEAKAMLQHKEELAGYKITPKGMLQLFPGQEIPKELLVKTFAETFLS